MQEKFQVGQVVRHFKREFLENRAVDNLRYLYRAIGEAEHTETGEELVIYQGMYDHKMYARPTAMFYSKVDKEKYPNVKQEYRFEKVEKWINYGGVV